MTVKIKLSTLGIDPQDFAQRVLKHAQAMREYNQHLEGVKADAANPDLKPEDRRVAFPPPSADPLVEQAVAEGYEFAGPTLDEKKQALFAEVKRLETEAIERILPVAKRRHWEFRERDIHAEDRARIAAEPQRIEDVESYNRDWRGAEKTEFLAAQQARHAKLQDVMRWAAKHEHDIADLTDETVDQYVISGEFVQ
jgi:hypothetical protein